MKNTIIRFAALLIMAVGLPLAMATPAHAASCYRLSCDLKDPQSAGCSADARTLAEINADTPYNDIHVEVRYSASCGAVWARGTQLSDEGYMWAGGDIWLERQSSGVLISSISGKKSTWTGMFSYWDYTLRACFHNATSTQCTNWV